MGLLNSDIGFALGQLAGGLWAKNYIERGEEKRAAAARNTIYDQKLQNWRALGDRLGVQPSAFYTAPTYSTLPYGQPSSYTPQPYGQPNPYSSYAPLTYTPQHLR